MGCVRLFVSVYLSVSVGLSSSVCLGLSVSVCVCLSVSAGRTRGRTHPRCLPPNVWVSDFGHLKFRGRSQHGEYATCIRHKALICCLSGHSRARLSQQQFYSDHLNSQYCDCVTYWQARGESRQKGLSVCISLTGWTRPSTPSREVS